MIVNRIVRIRFLPMLVTLGLVLSPLFQWAAIATAEGNKAWTYVLKEGTEVHLTFAEDLNSKTATVDDRVNFLLEEPLKVDDVVVAKAGSKAVGSITHVKKAGMLGKAGELNVRLEYLKVGETRVRLRANKGKEGEGKEGTMVVLAVLFGPIGLIKKGKNVEVKSGTALKAYIDEDSKLPADK